MATYSFSGLMIELDADDDATAVAPAVMRVAMPTGGTSLSYVIVEQEDEDLPLVEFTGAQRPYEIILDGWPLANNLEQQSEISIGRVTLAGGTTHDIMAIHTPGIPDPWFPGEFQFPPRDHVFLLGGDPLPSITTPEQFEAFKNQVTAIGPIPSGPFAPDTAFALTDVAAHTTTNTGPEILTAGYVERFTEPGGEWPNPFPFDQLEIGYQSRTTDPDWQVGDGSLLVLRGATYSAVNEVGSDLSVQISGYGASGKIIVAGEDSRFEMVARDAEAAGLTLAVGREGGIARVFVDDGATFAMVNPHSHASNQTQATIDIGAMWYDAHLVVADALFTVEGFAVTDFAVGRFDHFVRDGTPSLTVRDGGTFILAPEQMGDVFIGHTDATGALRVFSGATAFFDNTDLFYIGNGNDWWDANAEGFVRVDGADSLLHVRATSDLGNPKLRMMLGSSEGSAQSGTGLIWVTDGGRVLLENVHEATGSPSFLEMSLGFDQAGTGTIILDASELDIAGFDEARITVGATRGNGLISIENGSSLVVSADTEVELLVGAESDQGQVRVLGGSVMDLGGDALVRVGDWGDMDIGLFTSGSIRVAGPGSSVTGVREAWIGLDPAGTNGLVTPTGMGGLVMEDGARFGGTGAEINLGLLGHLQAELATVVGDLRLHSGTIDLGGLGFEQLFVDGNVTSVSGGMIQFAANAFGASMLETNGTVSLEGGNLTVLLGRTLDHSFAAGERHDLISAAQPIELAGGTITAEVMHFMLMPEFSFLFGIENAARGTFFFEALNDEDGSGTAILDLAGSTAASVTVDADSGRLLFEGGRFSFGLANRPDMIAGTAQADMIDLTGYGEAIAVMAGGGNDTIIGNGALTRAIFSGALGDYEIDTDVATGVTTVTDTRTGPESEGTNTLTNVGLLSFSDQDLPVDIGPVSHDLVVNVASRWGTPMEGVTVAVLPATGEGQNAPTDAGGAVVFELEAGTGGSISGAFDHTAGSPTITTGMALETLRISVGLNPSWGPAQAMDYIAADINGDGTVTTADALQLLRHAVGLATDHQPRWIFIDSEADLGGVTRTNASVPEGIEFAALDADAAYGLTGILVGHVVDTI